MDSDNQLDNNNQNQENNTMDNSLDNSNDNFMNNNHDNNQEVESNQNLNNEEPGYNHQAQSDQQLSEIQQDHIENENQLNQSNAIEQSITTTIASEAISSPVSKLDNQNAEVSTINLSPIPVVSPSEVTTLKIFIGSVGPNTTDNTYFKFFGKYGEMSDWVLMKRPDGKNKGFGFVTYKSKEVVAKVLSERLIIDGKEVQAYQAIPKESMAANPPKEAEKEHKKSNEKDKIPSKTNRLFIGSLTPAVVDSDIKNYFSKFGKLEDYFVMLEKVTNRPRGFGFAVFGI